MITDKTGAPTTVTRHGEEFAIAIDGGQTVGIAAFVDRGNQRILFIPKSTMLSRDGLCTRRGTGRVADDDYQQGLRAADRYVCESY